MNTELGFMREPHEHRILTDCYFTGHWPSIVYLFSTVIAQRVVFVQHDYHILTDEHCPL